VEARNLDFVVSACAAGLLQGSSTVMVSRICTDSRQAQTDDLFFALRGERFDAHAYLDEVAGKGVAAVVIERPKRPAKLPDCAVIEVNDTRVALGQLAAAYRKGFDVPVVAVGGSNGKTTTKNLIASVLMQKMNTLWSEASFNNDIGVPLTLLRLEKSHEAAVLEVGTNHPGELKPLVKMIQPRYGVITSIGREHLEFFGDVEGVAREEGMIAELLPENGRLFINGDSEWTSKMASRTRASAVRLGFGEANDWRVRSVRVSQKGTTFRVETANTDFAGEYKIALLGRHQVVNALFAIAIGVELGLDRTTIQKGLAECEPAKMRMQFWEHNGVKVLDDSYNANTDSALAALQVLKELPCKGRRVAVLGDMAELGAHSEAAHAEIGRAAADSGVGQLFAVGGMAATVARGARDGGLNRVIEIPDVPTAASAVKSFLKPGDLVLLKASRATKLERIAELLRAEKS
jgi:UDP-N-acetylmuramoyl-tripeptide--D-alanyl-D-alanine ligase